MVMVDCDIQFCCQGGSQIHIKSECTVCSAFRLLPLKQGVRYLLDWIAAALLCVMVDLHVRQCPYYYGYR